jgi:hypothetical protein
VDEESERERERERERESLPIVRERREEGERGKTEEAQAREIAGGRATVSSGNLLQIFFSLHGRISRDI